MMASSASGRSFVNTHGCKCIYTLHVNCSECNNAQLNIVFNVRSFNLAVFIFSTFALKLYYYEYCIKKRVMDN